MREHRRLLTIQTSLLLQASEYTVYRYLGTMHSEFKSSLWELKILLSNFYYLLDDYHNSKDEAIIMRGAERWAFTNFSKYQSEMGGQGFDPHSLQGRRSFSTFDRTGTSLSALGRGIVVYVSISPYTEKDGMRSITRGRGIRSYLPESTPEPTAEDVGTMVPNPSVSGLSKPMISEEPLSPLGDFNGKIMAKCMGT
ncbi:hypothetical protein Tco_0845674 [Tanacetum coccineum]